jgi:hypothetical protein
VCAPACIAVLVFASPAAHAAPPDPALALLVGASVFVGGFLVGGALLANANDDEGVARAGWLTIEGTFALAPFASHAVAGEWSRGLAFSAIPAAGVAGTAVVLGIVPGAIDHGEAPARVTIWSCMTAGLLTGIAGVVDATFADRRVRSVTVAPMTGSGELGLVVGGPL